MSNEYGFANVLCVLPSSCVYSVFVCQFVGVFVHVHGVCVCVLACSHEGGCVNMCWHVCAWHVCGESGAYGVCLYGG